MTTFNEMINDTKPILVDFSAEWCGPCKMMAPILKELAGEMGDEIRVVKVIRYKEYQHSSYSKQAKNCGGNRE
jgi:thioredoxin 1